MKNHEIHTENRDDPKNNAEQEKQLRMGAVLPMLIAMGSVAVILMFVDAFILETEVLFRGIQMMVQAALCVECWYYLAVQKKKLWLILGILWIFINAWTVWQFIQACMALV